MFTGRYELGIYKCNSVSVQSLKWCIKILYICETKKIRDFCRGEQGFRKGNQPRSNLLKVENVVRPVDAHSIVIKCKNHCCKLLNVLVHPTNDFTWTDIHNAQPLVKKFSSFEDEIASESLKAINLHYTYVFIRLRSDTVTTYNVWRKLEKLLLCKTEFE